MEMMMQTSFWQSRRVGVLLITLWLFSGLLFGASSAIYLNRTGRLTLQPWPSMTLVSIKPEIGFAYQAPTHHPELSAHKQPSPARVLENGVPLPGTANALHADIRAIGQGRYSFWHDYVYFSASDNSDPRTNGRRYELQYPRMIGSVAAWCIYGLTILAWIATILIIVPVIRERKLSIKSFWLLHPGTLLAVSCVGVTLAFLIPRLPWLIDYPVVLVFPDSGTYLQPVSEMLTGQWPQFSWRTPGYPLFLAAVLAASSSLKLVIILQNLIFLASGLFFLWAVYKTFPRLLVGAGVVMVAQMAQPSLAAYSMSILTEVVYASAILFCIGCFILMIYTRQSKYFFFCSFFACLTFLIRPAGVFLFSILPLTIPYLIINSYSKKNILWLCVPMVIGSLTTPAYNHVRSNMLEVSIVYKSMLYFITTSYWTTDDKFPENVNRNIRQLNEEMPQAYKQVLYTSWNPEVLYPLFIDNLIGVQSGKNIQKSVYDDQKLCQQERNVLANRIAWKAISSHPEMYVKWVWTMMRVHLNDTVWKTGNSYDTYAGYLNSTYQSDGNLIKKRLWMIDDALVYWEYLTVPKLAALPMTDQGDEKLVVFVPTRLYAFHATFRALLARVFTGQVWLGGYVLVFLASLVMTIRSRFHHQGAFVLFVLTLQILAAGFILAGINVALERYSGPTHFIQYLAVFLSPLLLMPSGARIDWKNMRYLFGGRKEHLLATPENGARLSTGSTWANK